jgi:hypothetical protein
VTPEDISPSPITRSVSYETVGIIQFSKYEAEDSAGGPRCQLDAKDTTGVSRLLSALDHRE